MLLWDFGDTLVDQRFAWTAPAGVPEWTEAYRSAVADGDLGGRWDRGEIGVSELSRMLASRLPMTTAQVSEHLEGRCRDITFLPTAWTAARTHAFAQALVTVNPDVFSDVVVPHYRLTEVFDVIVTSARERTADKAELCAVAVDRLACPSSVALLIDNIEANVDAWRARGGIGYWFRGDERFGRDLRAGGWDGLARKI